MSVVTGDVVTDVFTTSSPTTGAAADADSLPTGTLYLDGVANGATVTITDLTGTGRYSWSVTMPTLTSGQRVRVVIAATIGGLACGGDVWSDHCETRQTGDTFAKLAGITVLANWLRGMVRKDAMDATAKAELNAGGGTYNEATDSPEAIRDRGDAAWTTATGFSTLAAQDVRDAMKLAPSVGSPAAGSVDKHLDDIPTTAALDAAGVRTALGMAAADMDTQLDAILAASGGSVGPVNHTVTITDGADPVDNARVYLTSDLAGADTLVIVAGTFLTNASGQYQFLGLDAATYYWLHVEKAGFNFTPVRFQTDAS